MAHPTLYGIVPPIITPMNADESVNIPELRRQIRLLVHVHLAHLYIGALLGYFVHHGAQHPAGAAPAGPEVQQYGLFAVEHFLCKVFLGNVDDCHIFSLLNGCYVY